jgi:peptidoglycan/xylan/chitin deacetylase (PgdA/CDA1 family)
VGALAADDLVELGAHTASHPMLSAQSADVQRREIEESKERLEAIVGSPLQGFAYPFGGRADYTAITTRLVRDAGYQYACSNFPGKVGLGTRAFEIPRLVVRDWPGDEFERRLDAQLRN